MGEGAKETAPLFAGFAIVFEQEVVRADQPVFVHGVEFYPATKAQDRRASNKGDVVKVDDIKTFAQYILNLFCL